MTDNALGDDGQVESTSQALMGGSQGFAWVNIASGTPYANYSYNSAGGAISVASAGTGVYQVNFNGIGGSGGNAQVVAHGNSTTRCKLGGWGSSGTQQQVTVRCHTPASIVVPSTVVG